MSETPVAQAPPEAARSEAELLATPFVRELIKQIRAQDTHGVWEGKSDLKLLEPYIVSAEQRRALPMMGDPDPETLWRLELLYNAVGLSVERETGVMCQPMLKMHHEGFGRLVLIAGRLVAINKHLRDAHRFGFPSLTKLADAGEKLINEAVAMVRQFPEAAKYG